VEKYLQTLISGFVLMLLGSFLICLYLLDFRGHGFIWYSLGLLSMGCGIGGLAATYAVYSFEKKLLNKLPP
jgi:hypothetical protein